MDETARENQWASFRKDKADYLLSPDKAGNTALHMAARLGYEQVAAELIKQGHDVNAKNNYGESVLYAAITALKLPAGDDRAIQQALIDAGADVQAKTKSGETLLHAAARKGDIQMCEYLVDRRGLDVNVRDVAGSTPLHEAAWGRGIAVEALVERKADPSVRNAVGQTPRDLAVGAGAEKLDLAAIEQRLSKGVRSVDLPDPKSALTRLRSQPAQENKLAKGRSL